MKRLAKTALLGGTAVLLATAAAFLAVDRGLFAADHLDPPARTDPAADSNPDVAADIADVYAWHTATNVIIAVTFAGPQPGSRPPTYDRDVLYTINISNNSVPFDPEFRIRFRFGFNGQAVGVQFTGVPGSSGPIEGPVETNLVQGPVVVRAGLFDDPFFFDLQGFRETRSTGKLSFRSDRSFFTGQNDTAVVVQMPRSALENGTNPLKIWATTDRFGGNI
jgi:hypothetical protein